MLKNFPYKRLNNFLKEYCKTCITRDTLLLDENEAFGFYFGDTCYHVEKVDNHKYNIGTVKRMKVTSSYSNVLYTYDLIELNDKPLNFKQLKYFILGLL